MHEQWGEQNPVGTGPGSSAPPHSWAPPSGPPSTFGTPGLGEHYIPSRIAGGWQVKPPRSLASRIALGLLRAVLILALVLGLAFWLFGPRTSTTPPPPTPTAPSASAPANPEGEQVATREVSVTDQMRQGVVLVGGDTSRGRSSGTGVVVQPGIVLTNYHVVKGTTTLEITYEPDGPSAPAEMLGFSPNIDLAVLQVHGADHYPAAVIADEPVEIGDEVVAVGNARGGGVLYGTAGQVLGLDTSVEVNSSFGSTDATTLSGMIQSSAGAVPGYSGGPTLNVHHEVVGITTAGSEFVTAQMQSFSIPIDRALEVRDLVLTGARSPEVQVGRGAYLGVTMPTDSAVVESVAPGGPAEIAGVLPGESISEVSGVPVDTSREVMQELFRHNPGDVVTLTLTGDVPRVVEVTLGLSPTN